MIFNQQQIDAIHNLCSRYGVYELHLFGSALDESRFKNNSDLDFLVVFNDSKIEGRFDRFIGLQHGLEKLLERKVDLVSYHAIRNPFFKETVNATKQQIYSLDAA